MDYSNNTILVKSIKNGDQKAFSFLINSFHKKLCVYADSLINNHVQAEDLVQNVFINVWVNRKKMESTCFLQSYLYKSVYNEFIDQYRKTQSALRIEKKYIHYLNTLVEEENNEDNIKLIKLVSEIIKDLPPKCKQVFELSKKEGLSNIEISEHLNVSIKTVESHITKAFSFLRNKIGEKYDSVLFILFDIPTFRNRLFKN